jgi:hypothetical protein
MHSINTKKEKKHLLLIPKLQPVLFIENSTFYVGIKHFQQFTATRVTRKTQQNEIRAAP